MLVTMAIVVIAVTSLFSVVVLGRACYIALRRRNNPTWPDHRSLDDQQLAYEHRHGRLLDQPTRHL